MSLPDVVPAILRTRLPTMPDSLVSDADTDIKASGYRCLFGRARPLATPQHQAVSHPQLHALRPACSLLASDRRIRTLLAQNRLTQGSTRSVVQQALAQRTHWRAASTEASASPSLETPHNLVHVLCG